MEVPAHIKFSSLENEDVPYDYGNVWAREEFPTWSRLTIGPTKDHIDLIPQLMSAVPPPYGLLWVLVVPLEHETGRYQSPLFDDLDSVSRFLQKYKVFFEGDGRHHLWIMNPHGEGQIIYDNHNLIFAYGPLDEFESILTQRGFVPGKPEIPFPHAHRYNNENRHLEDSLMNEFEWTYFPLVEEHDDPD